MAFSQLPAYQVPNALNFEPLNNAVSGYKQAQSQNALAQYQAGQDAIQNKRQNALMGLQQQQGQREQTTFNQGQQDRAHKALAATFQAIGQEPPERRAQLYSQVRSRVKDFDQDVMAAGGDPNDMDSTMRMVTAQALGYQTPKTPEIKEVNGRLVAVSTPPGGTPSASEIYSAPGGGFKDAKQQADAEESLRKEFSGLSKEFVTVRDAKNQIDAIAKNPSPGADVALIYSFMKILDPGSVVRETEYATAQNAAGVPDQIRNVWNRILSGERLNENQRADFVNQARTVYGTREGSYRSQQEQFRGIAERKGLDPRNTMIEFAGGAPQAGTPAQNENSSIASQARQAPDGNFYVPDPSRPGKFLRVDP